MQVQRRRSNKVLIIIGVIVVFVIIGAISNIATGGKGDKYDVNNEEKNVGSGNAIPFSSYSAEGKNYQDIELQLQSAGFTNVTTTAIADLIVGVVSKEGDVKEVSVNGNTQFSEGDKFAVDAKIVVRYHVYREGSKESKSEDNTATDTTTEDDKDVEEATTKGTNKDSKASDKTSEWKQFLVDYEKWTDNYIAFLKKYYKNPSDVSLLSDYAKLTVELEKWTSKYEKIEDDLSGSDLEEFTKTYNRIYKKYMNALSKLQ